ncbi:lamin tail domain-containing protein [Methanochimaera problematica]
MTGINLLDEWVTIENKNHYDVDISGWRISDDKESNSYIFPEGRIIRSEKMITIYTEPGSNNNNELYWGINKDIWNDYGDTALLYDKDGKLRDSMTVQNQNGISEFK